MTDHRESGSTAGQARGWRGVRWSGRPGSRSRARHGEHTDLGNEPPHEPNWIAAYAMGLASARRRVEVCLQELIGAAGSERQRLCEARARVRKLQGFDPAVRAQAERLLTASLEQLEEDTQGTAGAGTPCTEVLDPLAGGPLEPSEPGSGDGEGETGTTMTRPGSAT